MALRRRFLFLGGTLPLAAALAACGSSTPTSPSTDAGALDAGTLDAGPVQGTYTIVFPSLSVAVDADAIQVFVFDASDGASQCLALINAQKGGGTLPATVPGIPTQPISPCKLDQGAGDLSLGFGNYAVLVAVEKAGQDIAIGCQQQTITPAAPTMSITVEILNVSVPTTTCTSLSAFCANTCG